ncbi:MAG: glycine cleavage system protein GcvH [Thermoanaerobaculia bacterium]|nr:glycine cleavage system protein GcvH [Thermoanaerobaculia bacterium]
MYPEDYRYSEEHEWLKVDGDTATLGITDFAQQELGEVVFVEMPEAGETFDAGEEIGSIESVKAVSDIYVPVACEIVEANASLDDSPETVNEDPHGKGWLVKIRITDPAALDELMDAAAYQAHIAS